MESFILIFESLEGAVFILSGVAGGLGSACLSGGFGSALFSKALITCSLVTSLSSDATIELTISHHQPIYGRRCIINGRIDMGAYEYSPPIQADVRIVPRTISLASKGKWIAAFLRLPEEYNVADIDPNRVFLKNEIEPEWFWLSEDNQIAIAKFDREEVRNILDVGDVELTITCQLADDTVFEGTDTIKVLNKASGKSVK